MSIRYDSARGNFVDGKRYVPPVTVAEMLKQAEAEVKRLRGESVRLRCCANCGQPHSFSLSECYSKPTANSAPEVIEEGWPIIEPDWRCQFYPSRWVPRDEEGNDE
jgi:hypothetical protein